MTKFPGSEEAKDEGLVGTQKVEVRARGRHLLNRLNVITASLRIFVQFVFCHLTERAEGRDDDFGNRDGRKEREGNDEERKEGKRGKEGRKGKQEGKEEENKGLFSLKGEGNEERRGIKYGGKDMRGAKDWGCGGKDKREGQEEGREPREG